MRRHGSITLGSGGVLYLVVSAMIFAAAVYTQANLLFAAFGLVAGGLVVSIFWSLIALRRITVRRELPAYGVAGEPLTIRYEVHNASRIPAFSVVVTETPSQGNTPTTASHDDAGTTKQGLVEGWLVHVGPNQQVTAEATCWPTRRGELRFHRVRVWTSFPFGVFRRSVWLDVPAQVLVLPRMHRLDRQLLQTTLGQDAVGTRRRNRPGTSGEFFGLRDYRAGDPPRLIDWKRSARANRLVAREMTQPCPPRVMVRLDLSAYSSENREEKNDKQIAEDAITLTASLINESHRHGYSTGLAINGPSAAVFPPRHGLPHRTAMLDALARLDLDRSGHQPQAGMIVPSIIVQGPGVDTSPGTQHQERNTQPNNGGSRRVRLLQASELAEYVAHAAPEDFAKAERETDSRMLINPPRDSSDHDAVRRRPTEASL